MSEDIGQNEKPLSGALCLTGKTLRRTTNGLDVAMIKIANFRAIHEENAVTQPVEAIGKDDLAFGSCGGTVNINGGTHLVAIAQIDLALVRSGECMGLPKRHVSIIAGK